MTKATPQTSNKKQVQRPTCPQCKTRFRTATSKGRKYCSDDCRVSVRNTKRRVTSVKKATNSPFFYHLAYEVERSGTLQILQGHTRESLLELVSLYKNLQIFNGYGERKEIGLEPFELSHIFPVKHPTHIGLYCAENLVISPKVYNRAHGTNHFGYGSSINRLDLDSKHSVAKGTPRKQTVERILKYLGSALVDEVVREAKLQPSKRHKLTEWLLSHLDPTIKEHKAHIAALDTMSTVSMSKLKLTLQGKSEVEEGEGECIELKRAAAWTDSYVLMHEWERLSSSSRPDLLSSYQRVNLLIGMSCHMFSPTFDSIDAQLVFDTLHGKPAVHILPVVESQYALAHSNPKLKLFKLPKLPIQVQEILVEAPIESSYTTLVVPTVTVVQLPSKALTRPSSSFASFAEEADWEMEQDALQMIVEPSTRAPVHSASEEYEDDGFEFECIYQEAA